MINDNQINNTKIKLYIILLRDVQLREIFNGHFNFVLLVNSRNYSTVTIDDVKFSLHYYLI